MDRIKFELLNSNKSIKKFTLLFYNKTVQIAFLFYLFNISSIYAQSNITPSLDNLQGIWNFKDKGYESYMLINNNRSIRLSMFGKDSNVVVYGKPFSYFGFWSNKNSSEPLHLRELEKSGDAIVFYDDLVPIKSQKQGYDSLGNLYGATRTCLVTLNEDSDEKSAKYLRFYYKAIPDLYVKIERLPEKFVLSLKNSNSTAYGNFLIFKSFNK